MKKILTGLVLEVLGGKEAVRKAVREALLEALEEAFQEDEPRKRARAKAQAEADEAEAKAPVVQAETPKAKGTRRKGTQADGAEVRKLIQALADLGPHLGTSPSGKPMEEVLANRGESLARHALPGHAKTVLSSVLEYLRSFPLEEAKREALRGFRDLAEVAGVGHLLRPKA